MANRPDLPNILDLQKELSELKSAHCKLRKEYDSHLLIGFGAGGATFVVMLVLQIVLAFSINNYLS